MIFTTEQVRQWHTAYTKAYKENRLFRDMLRGFDEGWLGLLNYALLGEENRSATVMQVFKQIVDESKTAMNYEEQELAQLYYSGESSELFKEQIVETAPAPKKRGKPQSIDREKVAELRAQHYTQTQIAGMLGCSVSAIKKIYKELNDAEKATTGHSDDCEGTQIRYTNLVYDDARGTQNIKGIQNRYTNSGTQIRYTNGIQNQKDTKNLGTLFDEYLES